MKQGAECKTDHQLLCIKMRLIGAIYRVMTCKRFGVFERTKSAQDDVRLAVQASFVEAVEDKIKDVWSECKTGDDKWAIS